METTNPSIESAVDALLETTETETKRANEEMAILRPSGTTGDL